MKVAGKCRFESHFCYLNKSNGQNKFKIPLIIKKNPLKIQKSSKYGKFKNEIFNPIYHPWNQKKIKKPHRKVQKV